MATDLSILLVPWISFWVGVLSPLMVCRTVIPLMAQRKLIPSRLGDPLIPGVLILPPILPMLHMCGHPLALAQMWPSPCRLRASVRSFESSAKCFSVNSCGIQLFLFLGSEVSWEIAENPECGSNGQTYENDMLYSSTCCLMMGTTYTLRCLDS